MKVFLPSFARRRRRAPEVKAPPEIKPLEWTSWKKKPCENPDCPHGEAGRPKMFIPEAGPEIGCSPECRKALRKVKALEESRTPKARARQQKYREKNRETIRAKVHALAPARYCEICGDRLRVNGRSCPKPECRKALRLPAQQRAAAKFRIRHRKEISAKAKKDRLANPEKYKARGKKANARYRAKRSPEKHEQEKAQMRKRAKERYYAKKKQKR
jgi:hypothetical protein